MGSKGQWEDSYHKELSSINTWDETFVWEYICTELDKTELFHNKDEFAELIAKYNEKKKKTRKDSSKLSSTKACNEKQRKRKRRMLALRVSEWAVLFNHWMILLQKRVEYNKSVSDGRTVEIYSMTQ